MYASHTGQYMPKLAYETSQTKRLLLSFAIAWLLRVYIYSRKDHRIWRIQSYYDLMIFFPFNDS